MHASHTGGIGGYHSVAMPFDQSAKDMVRSLASGQHNFVELVRIFFFPCSGVDK